MTEQDNLMIAETLGICWHEVIKRKQYWVGRWSYYREICSCGDSFSDHVNPDFSNRDAFWLILKEGPKQEWWDEFMRKSGVGVWYDSASKKPLWAIKQYYLGHHLAEELLKFLKGRERG